MIRTLLPLVTACALIAGPALADVGPVFLPDLTFPTPPSQPDTSTQGCATLRPCT
ncbi:hypothetical protein [Antarctobacter sp.]|uniref:hypothetical protein n=1 Tax=Antarctobacter sp. TaxID=1872577 RepID=UPI002B265124|nr:hypothetical protein [Antarctobacter sp.]